MGLKLSNIYALYLNCFAFMSLLYCSKHSEKFQRNGPTNIAWPLHLVEALIGVASPGGG